MDKPYISKKFTKNDISMLLQLYLNVFGLKIKSVNVANKFFNDYQKVNASHFVSKDIIASFYGMIVQKAVYNNSSFFIGQSCDSMTHKDHGGKGLFVNLAKEVYEDLKKEGIDYVFGFPNDTIYNLRIKKLHWQHNENINVFKIKVGALPLAKVVKKLPILKSIYNFYLGSILSKHKSNVAFFANSVLKADVAGVLHDVDYYNYKKTDNKFIIKINNINLWIKIDGFLWVGDFENTTNTNFEFIINILKNIARNAGCVSIVFHFQEGTNNDKLLQNYFSIYSKMPVGFINLTDKHKNKIFKFSGSDFDSW